MTIIQCMLSGLHALTAPETLSQTKRKHCANRCILVMKLTLDACSYNPGCTDNPNPTASATTATNQLLRFNSYISRTLWHSQQRLQPASQ
jgi:hypothetical protein